jgi:thiol-disulfide isomerase/thioredoxin
MNKKIILGLSVFLFVAISKAAFVNDSAPPFTLVGLDGKSVELKSFHGDVVLVNFWASWCPPCKQEFPELNELANEYKNQPFHLLAVNLDKSPDRVLKFLDKNQVKTTALTILLDPDAKVVAQYVARSMPSSFIIDKTGTIRFVHFGFSDKDPVKWRTEIDSLLAEIKKK